MALGIVEVKMGWIRERILLEQKKHYRVTGGLDWARLAEQKIVASLKEDINGTKLGCWAGGLTARINGSDNEELQEYTDKTISSFCEYLIGDLDKITTSNTSKVKQ